MKPVLITIVLAPLVAAAVAGLFGRRIGRAGAHWVTILGVGLSCALSAWVLTGLLTGSLGWGWLQLAGILLALLIGLALGAGAATAAGVGETAEALLLASFLEDDGAPSLS